VVTLGVGGAAVLARFTRSAMLEVLGQPYIRTASAKGVSWRAVVTYHALPNAAIPTVTIIGFMVGTLIAGAVVVESVFSWPGVGRLLVVAVANRDLAWCSASCCWWRRRWWWRTWSWTCSTACSDPRLRAAPRGSAADVGFRSPLGDTAPDPAAWPARRRGSARRLPPMVTSSPSAGWR
jgi:hypothetical protein